MLWFTSFLFFIFLADVMYNGEMNEKIKLLYKLHIPPGKKSKRKLIPQFPQKSLAFGKSLVKNPIFQLRAYRIRHTGYTHCILQISPLITNGTFLDEMYRLQCQSSHICCILRSFAANYMVTSRQNTN